MAKRWKEGDQVQTGSGAEHDVGYVTATERAGRGAEQRVLVRWRLAGASYWEEADTLRVYHGPLPRSRDRARPAKAKAPRPRSPFGHEQGHAAKAELKRVEQALDYAIRRVPWNRNVWDEPQVKRLMERRVKLLGIPPNRRNASRLRRRR